MGMSHHEYVSTWNAGVHAFRVEIESDRTGYCGVKFASVTDGPLTPDERRLFFFGLIRAIAYHKMPDRICIPLLNRSEVQKLMPR